MATLLFSAVGTMVGGPLGGALGALVGRQFDHSALGGGRREGPRLKELAVSASSYGTPLPRHFGTIRVGGTIIWATDLVESREAQGGGKGRPATTGYSYSASFAVALASRPIRTIRRIWADGNLLRGAAGDLKTGGTIRIYAGTGEQAADPLIAAAVGADRCPAFRGTAYVLFEDLQLGDFGNRIPALTFEVIADEEPLSVAHLASGVLDRVAAPAAMAGLAGLSCEGPLADTLAALDPVFPLDCDAAGDILALMGERAGHADIGLAEPALTTEDEDFGALTGFARKRLPPAVNPPGILRYYDLDRDFQPGLQRAPGQPAPGQPQTIELPAALSAANARDLIARTARREAWSRETLSWRSTTLDPRAAPGAIVTVPGQMGRWKVLEWEWRPAGVELTLLRMPPGAVVSQGGADSGEASLAPDLALTPTQLAAFELPWDGSGSGTASAVFAALSSSSAGWRGAALYAVDGAGGLTPLSPGGRRRAVLGHALTKLPAASPMLIDRQGSIDVQLAAPDLAVGSLSIAALVGGGNRALLGSELIQFGRAVALGDGRWRLSTLLRGLGGTEAAIHGHAPGESFVFLGDALVPIEAQALAAGAEPTVAALGLGDETPVTTTVRNRGLSLRPLTPVHGRCRILEDGGVALTWTRRARGAWTWSEAVDVPVNEQSESYFVRFGTPLATAAQWQLTEPHLTMPEAELVPLLAAAPDGAFEVRQQGTFALSDPLILRLTTTTSGDPA